MKLSGLKMWPRGSPGTRALSSVRGRIIAGIGLMVVVLVAVAAGSAWQVLEHRSHTAALQDRAEITFLLLDAQANAESAATSVQRYVIVGDEVIIPGNDDILLPLIDKNVTTAIDDLAQAIALEKAQGHEEDVAVLTDILVQGTALAQGSSRIIALRQSGNVEEATAAFEEIVLPFREFETNLNEAAEKERAEAVALREEAHQAAARALWILVISSSLAAALGVAAAGFMARSILRPLSSLQSTAMAVAGGDLKARATSTGLQELAALGASLNRMTESLLDASKRRELEEERKQAEEALEKKEAQLRTIMEASPDHIWLLDKEFRILYGNRAGSTQNVEDLVGISIPTLLPEEKQAEARQHLERALKSKTPYEYEADSQAADGSRSVFENIAVPLESDGQVVGLVLNSRDITERKRSEDALARYKLLFSKANDLAYICDAEGSILYVNEVFERLSGHMPEEFIGKSFAPLFDGEDLAIATECYEQTLKGGTPQFEVTFKDTGILCEYTNLPHRDDEGAIIGVFGIARDITERKQAEEALRESEHFLLESQSVAQIGCGEAKPIRT